MQTPFQSTTVSSFFVSNGRGDIKWRPIIRNAFILFNIISTLVPLLRRYSRNIFPEYFYYTEMTIRIMKPYVDLRGLSESVDLLITKNT